MSKNGDRGETLSWAVSFDNACARPDGEPLSQGWDVKRSSSPFYTTHPIRR